MSVKNGDDRGQRLATWVEAEFAKFNTEQQTVFGQAVMMLTAAAASLPPRVCASIQTSEPRSSTCDTPASQDRRPIPSEHRWPPKSELLKYLEDTNAPLRSFLECEKHSNKPRRTNAPHRQFGDDASSTLLRGALKRLQKSLARTAADAAADSDDHVSRGLLSKQEATAMMDAYTEAPDPARTKGEDMLDAKAMARLLGVSRTTVYKRFNDGRIIGLTREAGGRVYPKTQFDDHDSPRGPNWLPIMEKIVANHGNGWRAWIWLNNPRDEFDGQSALDRLHAGDGVAVEIALNREDEGAFR
ncbi:helix-turn-helix domain-containing protein [Salinisphaera dokdonensis]